MCVAATAMLLIRQALKIGACTRDRTGNTNKVKKKIIKFEYTCAKCHQLLVIISCVAGEQNKSC